MKVEKCILKMLKGTDDPIGSIVIPNGIFEISEDFNLPYKFLAVKKRNSPIFKLIPIEMDKGIFEVYCEVIDNQRIGNVVELISKFTHKHDTLTLLSETEGICMGQGSEYPCTFDGFVVLEGENESLIISLKKELKELSFEGNLILSKLTIEELI